MPEVEIEFLNDVMIKSIALFPDELKPHIGEIAAFRIGLASESDRAVALMAAAFLEDYLAQLISKKMLDNAKVRNEMYEHNGPLGTFSAKINTAYMFGLISQAVRNDLHLLRKIRNEFAHTAKPLEFTEHRIKSRCNELTRNGLHPKHDAPRSRFNRAMMIAAQEIAITLTRTGRSIEQPSPPNNKAGKETIQNIINFMKDNGMDASVLENGIDFKSI
ncbi:MltR family transcriptional regulator [Pseudomonas sp. S2_D10]